MNTRKDIVTEHKMGIEKERNAGLYVEPGAANMVAIPQSRNADTKNVFCPAIVDRGGIIDQVKPEAAVLLIASLLQ
ncbi:MAG TPA: hypothetical protein VGL10_07125 [Gammaproteobacteria bacterium]